MKLNQPIEQRTNRKFLKVGIVDLIATRPTGKLFAKLVNPNYASIMPQVVAVWVEQMGHEAHFVTYTGFENLYSELPDDIDILFISAFTQAAFLAYSISNIYRKRNVVTVLGGPHARAYAEDAKDYFDYVIGLTDRTIIHDLLQDFSPHPNEGVVLNAEYHPRELPGVRERWKFIQQNLDKSRIIHVVPIIGSFGCPYRCSFCVDSEVDYQTLPYDQIREDLKFLQEKPNPPIVAWYDPNFGVRFDDYMEIIESVVKSGTLRFSAESSLSLLSEPHLKRLNKNNFLVMSPGIESWFEFNDKSKQSRNVGLEKVESVAEQARLISHYIPYVQTNSIFGLDSDDGQEPFDLTKRFVELAPGVYPNYLVLTSFGNAAPLNHQYQLEERVIDIPFPFLDGYSISNVRFKNYSYVEFYNNLIDLVRFSFSSRMVWKRFRANKHSFPRWMNLLRTISSDKGGGARKLVEIRNHFATDREFEAFYSGVSIKPPTFFLNKIKEGMGSFYDQLPPKVLEYLERGEPEPNPRIFNFSNKVVQAVEPST
ncbi:MAG: radical SAM protein [Candidatus Latescibacteria bacterium]|nr:radical SAM protein [Candidatus Latescibacterota bacterium]NIO57346.1 radical SAM protein [Candidatus Latescibacterota bacterium]